MTSRFPCAVTNVAFSLDGILNDLRIVRTSLSEIKVTFAGVGCREPFISRLAIARVAVVVAGL